MRDYNLIQHASKFEVVGGPSALKECCRNPANLSPPIVARDRADVSRQICRVCNAKHIRFHAESPQGECCSILGNLEQIAVTCEDDSVKRFQCKVCGKKQTVQYVGDVRLVTSPPARSIQVTLS